MINENNYRKVYLSNKKISRDKDILMPQFEESISRVDEYDSNHSSTEHKISVSITRKSRFSRLSKSHISDNKIKLTSVRSKRSSNDWRVKPRKSEYGKFLNVKGMFQLGGLDLLESITPNVNKKTRKGNKRGSMSVFINKLESDQS
mmetsp:Transcript_23539/g.20890  ORF Transcript_23539/g.20890 Transcript_23539/m.20890 type:complete len:146 (+) Transcript_23539:251-688(+)